jgi:hypothetical protein
MKQNVLSIYRSAGRLRVVSIDPLIDLDPVIARPRGGSAVQGRRRCRYHNDVGRYRVACSANPRVASTTKSPDLPSRRCNPLTPRLELGRL